MASPSLFLNDFTVIDYAFVDAASGIQGDSYYVSAELEGELDDKDFLLDFSVAKKLLKAFVDETFDHKLLVPAGAGVSAIRDRRLELHPKDGSRWTYECPRDAFVHFPDAELNSQVVAYHLGRLVEGRLPPNVQSARFTLRSSPRFGTEANFRYTHGLRFHDGNCQRLFHGHRNPVEVWVGGSRAGEWEEKLAQEWDGAHFVANATLRNRKELDLQVGQRQFGHGGTAEVEYESGQGLFRATLPASRVVLTETEPSIETMARLGLSTLRVLGLREPARVVAYEGLNKGAAF